MFILNSSCKITIPASTNMRLSVSDNKVALLNTVPSTFYCWLLAECVSYLFQLMFLAIHTICRQLLGFTKRVRRMVAQRLQGTVVAVFGDRSKKFHNCDVSLQNLLADPHRIGGLCLVSAVMRSRTALRLSCHCV